MRMGHLPEMNPVLILAQLEQAIEDMTNLINSPSQAPSSSMQHAVQRHRDNLDDYKRDFFRTRVGCRLTIKAARFLVVLISSVLCIQPICWK